MKPEYGNLTPENIEEFAKCLQKMLAHKRYTFVSVNGGRSYLPEIRVHQQLEGRINTASGVAENIRVYPFDSNIGTCRHMNVCDTYGVWSLDTINTYFSFEPKRWGEPERVTIRCKTGDGYDLYWLIAVED